MLDPKFFLHIDALSQMLIILRPLSSLDTRFMDNLHITVTFAVAAAMDRNLVGGRGVFGRERERIIVRAGATLALGHIVVRLAAFSQSVWEQRSQERTHDRDAGASAAYTWLENRP